ncbi:MAG: hypothetical protein HC767_11650 [Akkermansiaceae bacterium]|nr:hypothetical protein [Akkermansiaceae bacterium]
MGHTDSCRVLLRYGASPLQLDHGGAPPHGSEVTPDTNSYHSSRLQSSLF